VTEAASACAPDSGKPDQGQRRDAAARMNGSGIRSLPARLSFVSLPQEPLGVGVGRKEAWTSCSWSMAAE